MSRFSMALLIGATLALCSPSAQAAFIEWTFPITVGQEVPTPDIPEDFNPFGTGTITLDTETLLFTWDIQYEGLTGDAIGAHFHGPAGFGETAGIVVDIGTGPPSGSFVGDTTLTEAQAGEVLSHLWYVNLHTELNPAGEIRGQVVPEPSALGLLASGGALLGLTLWRRRRRARAEAP